MAGYLLDTNIVSELHKPKPNGAVLAWFNELRDSQMWLSAVTLYELQEGIERTRRMNEAKAIALEAWVDELEQQFSVLPMDGPCFRQMVRMMIGKPDDLFDDAMIAATAAVHRLTVATRNEKNFWNFGVLVFNPFKFPRTQ